MARAPDEMTTTTTVDDDDVAVWEPDDRTLLYDPKFHFPPEALLALARAHALCFPDLVHRERRRRRQYLDSDDDAADVAYVFGLEGLAIGDSSSGALATTTTAAADSSSSGVEEVECSELVQDQELAYAAVVEPEEPNDYVLVGTAEEVERERQREADAEARFMDGWNDQVRSIERFLDEIDEENDREAMATWNSLVVRGTDVDFFDGLLEKEAASSEVGRNVVPVVPASEDLAVNVDDDEDAVPEWV